MDWKQLLFSFEGRVGRAPYWYFVLALIVIFGILGAVLGVSITHSVNPDGTLPPSAGAGGILLPIILLIVIWPCLAVQAKRWHDVDKSAWWILIGLVPVVGGLIALVFNGFIPGTPGANRFGGPPA
jgi:uncharacterized membrane protein YhaH (DUF805 family)